MSRCFPFPPPGYEKKTRVDDTDLLTKEKHKEKKHKKDKKDKEKREGKDKKDKDRSKEKHKEKKDQKEKLKVRDRDKDKDKDRDREKNQTSDEKRIGGEPGFLAEENLVPINFRNCEIKDSKYVQELARRIRDEDRASGSQTVQDVSATDQRVNIPRLAVESGVLSRSEEDKKVKSKYEEHRKINGQRDLIDSKGVEKLFSQNLSYLDQERTQAITKTVEKKDPEKQVERKEKSKHKDTGAKGDKSKSRDREKNRKSKEKNRDKEKKKEEKAKETSELSKELPKLKDSGPKLKETGKDLLDFRNAKPSDPLKLSSLKPSDPLKLSSTKPSAPLNLISMKPSDSIKLGSMKPTGPLNLSSVKPSDSFKPGSMSSASEGNLGKRKEHEINGYILESEIRPNKVTRPISSPNSVVENGRKLEPCQTAAHFASKKQSPASNHKVDVKEHKINGLIAGKQLSVCPTRPPSTKVPANGNREAPAKPPHPDAEYLSRILCVPKVEELPDLDDQEWLFSSELLQKKPNMGSSEADEAPQVWAETLQIESADIHALPYVIPY